MDVQLSEFDIVQPDLIIVLNESVRKITPTKIKVAPHLVVEILSPSNMDYDRITKRELYERFGVKEYWVVDPFDQQVDQWVLAEEKYVLMPKSKVVQLSIAPDIEVDFDTVW
jgi:Uma2 family endonuclease